jgi:hypothetical protein
MVDEKPKLVYRREDSGWWLATELLNPKNKPRRKLVQLEKQQPEPAVPDITIKEVPPKTRSQFIAGLKRNHKSLYDLLVRISTLELSLPTAYADTEETLRLLANNRQISINSTRVVRAAEHLIEMAVIRHLASQLKTPPKDLERTLSSLWPAERTDRAGGKDAKE